MLHRSVVTGILFLFTVNWPISANEITAEELERWFNSDSLEPPRYKEVNDGHLVFLQNIPDKKLHHHYNALTILPDSLESGWVKIIQCHRNIDKVPAAQIVFKAERIKNITITEFANMEKAWIENATVQMENIQQNAYLCLSASTNSLERNHDGTYTLRNGPFMRRFFDGYFPLRVSMDLNFDKTNLQLMDFSPAAQSGFSVKKAGGFIHIDTVFEGKLNTVFHFKRK